ncbi:hypothetical protein QBL02_06030 [Leucobacter sp. UT-8R-CII-1-4]|uniref:hypothetical protein n=1 Tax=Leucobacter sp. UT-8R-CII-1-4 TaxID=3040075 RepID=UPI0024A9F2E3|nr:hypothetical protein [Leucobacter sp. UT-8R-CII-1-4]MDI6023101.1 hypothetical protein [Leucobacter sp. UT-8R-CII-1-4]
MLSKFEQSSASGVWDLFSALKQPRWGLALQPDEGDGGSAFRESFGRVKRADFPPRRGFTVDSGRILQIHVGIALILAIWPDLSSRRSTLHTSGMK